MSIPKNGVKYAIIYDNSAILGVIPLVAYEYIINGKSAIECIMERDAITTDKTSGINACHPPRYIIDLCCLIVTVSVETVCIVCAFPLMEIIR